MLTRWNKRRNSRSLKIEKLHGLMQKKVSMITSLCKKKYSTATDSSTKKKLSFDVNEKAIFHCKCSFVSAPVFSTTVVTSTEAAITLLNSPNTHNDYKLLLPQYLKPNPLSLQLLSIDWYCHCQKIMTHLYVINKS